MQGKGAKINPKYLRAFISWEEQPFPRDTTEYLRDENLYKISDFSQFPCLAHLSFLVNRSTGLISGGCPKNKVSIKNVIIYLEHGCLIDPQSQLWI